MSSSDGTPPRIPAPQSIPLQDLSRPPDTASASGSRTDGDSDGRSSRHLHSRSLFSRALPGSNYERLAGSSPTRRGESRRVRSRSQGGQTLQIPTLNINDETMSPIEDLGTFAAASLGLSFDDADESHPLTPPPIAPRPSITLTPEDGHQEGIALNDSESFFVPNDNDTTPLTNRSRAAPSSSSTPRGQRHDRHSTRTSLHWVDGTTATPPRLSDRPSPRLGDDLPHLDVEHGMSRRPSTGSVASRLSVGGGDGSERSRSLSPSASPMSRANSMLRAMSQRVVNLSNDTDMVEQNARRKSSVRHPRPSISQLSETPEEVPRVPSIDFGSRLSTDEKLREPSIVPIKRRPQF